tara:strand:+ start:3850 stop:5490 length:1641 start_codon:yes stop_codon:yes gene_type:complete
MANTYTIQLDGETLEVPQEELSGAINMGAKLKEGQKFNIKMPGEDGVDEIIAIPAQELNQARELGGTFASNKDILDADYDKLNVLEKGLIQTSAAAENFLDVATFGLSGEIFESLSPEYAARAAQREELDLAGSTVGQIGGIFAPTGGAGLAAKGLGAIAKPAVVAKGAELVGKNLTGKAMVAMQKAPTAKMVAEGAMEATMAGAKLRGADPLEEILDMEKIVYDGILGGVFGLGAGGLKKLGTKTKGVEKNSLDDLLDMPEGVSSFSDFTKQMRTGKVGDIPTASIIEGALKMKGSQDLKWHKTASAKMGMLLHKAAGQVDKYKDLGSIATVGGFAAGGIPGAAAAWAGPKLVKKLSEAYKKNPLWHEPYMLKGVEFAQKGADHISGYLKSTAKVGSYLSYEVQDEQPLDAEQRATVVNLLDAMNSPGVVIDNLKDGIYNKDQVELLMASLPDWESTKADIISEMMHSPDPLTRSQRFTLQQLTGIPYSPLYGAQANVLANAGTAAVENAAQGMAAGKQKQSKVLTGKANKVKPDQLNSQRIQDK